MKDVLRGQAPDIQRATSIPPDSVRDLKKLILSRRVAFSKTAVRTLYAALQRPEIVAFGTIKDLAEIGGVSQTSVHRALRVIGYNHFAEFREMFRLHMRARAATTGTMRGHRNCH